jgi:hypothetical protein
VDIIISLPDKEEREKLKTMTVRRKQNEELKYNGRRNDGMEKERIENPGAGRHPCSPQFKLQQKTKEQMARAAGIKQGQA